MKKYRLINPQSQLMLAAMGLSGLVAGCNASNPLVQPVNAQEPIVPTLAPLPTLPPNPTAAPSPTIAPSPTAWFTPTPLPTATPWSAPVAWHPASIEIPTLQPLPVVAAASANAMVQGAMVQGVLPVSYSPPDGVDMFGGGLLRWEFYGDLAADEWFDIRIKPVGSNDSVFVDWTKDKEYPLGTWNGWQPGLYTWQIGIIKGYKEGDTKHFIEDTGRASQPFLIKWQSGGGGGGGGGSTGGGGGGGSTGGGGGGGGNSGGS